MFCVPNYAVAGAQTQVVQLRVTTHELHETVTTVVKCQMSQELRNSKPLLFPFKAAMSTLWLSDGSRIGSTDDATDVHLAPLSTGNVRMTSLL